MLSIVAARYIDQHRLHVTFSNGVEGEADLADCEWKGMMQPLANPQFFRYFAIDHGTLVWPNDVDLAPEFFYFKVTGKYPGE